MSSSASNAESEHRRKRLRKGTHSCWECKRRKIRCQLSSEDVPICSGCLARGTKCLSQDFPEGEEISTSNSHIQGRLGRVEQLLETLVAKISSFEEEEKMMTPESLATDDILTAEPNSMTYIPAVHETAPFLALFDNTALGRREVDLSQAPTPTSQSAGAKSVSFACGRVPRVERIRQALLELLPPQHVMDRICEASSFWLNLHAFAIQTFDPLATPKFDLAEISKGSPTSIARILLYLASCLQQLDAGFDTTQLKLYPSVEARMERYVATVQTLVTSDEELVSSIDGLDCLIVQCSYHINAGNPRRAWLTIRKALNIGQLMGIHLTSCTIPVAKHAWSHIVQGDRYLSMLLGLPCGSQDMPIGPDENFQNPDINKDDLFSRKMFNIVGRIIERNQNEQMHTYTTTQKIDEEFEKLAAEMPKEWWEIPQAISGRSRETLALYDRITYQLCYFQFQGLLHLPFMLRATTERRYEYNKFSCMKAAREMLHRFLALRKTDMGNFCCRIIDFGAFTASVTLFLGILEPDSREQLHQRDNDRRLIEAILASMEEIERQRANDPVASQSADAIRSLLAIDSTSGQHTTNLKLSIPYFGTISVVRPQSSSPSNRTQSLPDTLPANMAGQDMNIQPRQNLPFSSGTPLNAPLVSFTSNRFSSAMPEQVPTEGWEMSDTDTMFFDSLLNQDLAMMNFPVQQGNENQGW